MEPPRDLTIPEEGSTTARRVLSAALRRLLGDLEALPVEHAASPGARRAYRAMRAVVARALREDPGAMLSVLRQPTVGAPIRALRGRPADGSGEAELGDLTATVLLELAAAGALPGPVRMERVPPLVPCLRGRFALRATPVPVTFEPGAVVLHGRDGDRRVRLDQEAPELARPYHPVEGALVLAEVDNNPLRMVEAHPDKLGNALDLGGRSADDWVAALREALGVVRGHLPALHDELLLYVQQVVPVGYDPERHLSASYREAIGTIYLTLHPQPMTMAEALIHEHGHGKLNALLELDPLLDDALTPLYRSPLRPDPRPLHGVLLAVHAFLPVARLYERMVEAGHPWSTRPDFRRRFAEVVAKNRQGTRVLLEHARPTPTGRGLLDEITSWNAHFERLRA